MFSLISHGFPPTSQNASELASLKSPLGVKEHVYVCPRGALQCTRVLGVGYCPGLLVFSHYVYMRVYMVLRGGAFPPHAQ